MAINTVTVAHTTNTVSMSPADNVKYTLSLSNPNVAMQVVSMPVAVSVETTTIGVVTAGVQGPEGALGPIGPQGPTSGDEISVLNKAEQKNTVEDSPGIDDITVYYGIANPQSALADPVWLVTRQIFLADGNAFDSQKTFASTLYDQVWNDHLSLTYT